MTKARKKKSSGARFALFMALYALLFGLAIVVGMRLFWGYIAEYEATRVNHAIDAYMDSFDEEHIARVTEPFLSSLDPAVQDPVQSRKAVDLVMQAELRYRRVSAESNSNRSVYKIYSGDHEAGRVVLTRPDNPRFGFSSWSVAEESFDFAWLLDGDEITVPVGWTVSVNGTPLDESHIVQSDIRYAYLKDFYGKGLPELYQCTYRVENYVGAVPFELTDGLGRPVSLEERSEERYLDNCTPEEKAAGERFIEEFLPYYIECQANTRRNAADNYNRIKRFLVPDSGLDRRIRGGIGGNYYAQSNGENILSLDYDRHIKLGDGVYLVEFTYQLESVSKWEAQTHKRQVTLQIVLVQQADGGLLAQAVYNLDEIDL